MARVCGLTFELSGWPRQDGLPVWRIMHMQRYAGKTSCRGQSALERGVRQHLRRPHYLAALAPGCAALAALAFFSSVAASQPATGSFRSTTSVQLRSIDDSRRAANAYLVHGSILKANDLC